MTNSLLQGVSGIYAAARASDDGDRCCVAPSPELQDKIDEQLASLRASADLGLGRAVRLQEPARLGFNDGLIVPGDMLPLGTPPSVARNFALERAPLTGDVRVIIVLVDFTDQHMTQTQDHFRQLFFSTGVLPHGSVREYFTDVTGGLVNIVGDVVGPFRMPQSLATYAHGESGIGGATPNATTMARDAVLASNPGVNFAPYDNDGNGFVDAFIVVHAGPGAEVTGNDGHIWSHKWTVAGGAMNVDGTKIFAYLTVPEDCRIGVCAHELGHLLFGFPDLYDTDSSSAGVGNWCLMGGGSWLGGGDIPAHPSAWCKCNQGWAATINQTTNATVSIPDVKTSRQVYRLWKDGAPGSEYFLVENRQKTGYDQHLPGAGLLIWHIDESISGNSSEFHPKVALAQADGLNQLATGTARGDAGDPFPGTANNRTFNSGSTPNSKSYAGANTCVSVTSIGDSGSVMSARLSVKCGKVLVKETVKEHLKETFKEKNEVAEKPLTDKTFRAEKSVVADKRIEKPITDKAAARDKGFVERPFDDFRDRFRPQGVAPSQGDDERAELADRVARLEEALAAVQPFISEGLRPDLSRGALSQEDDEELNTRAAAGEHGAKRQMDSKLPDR